MTNNQNQVESAQQDLPSIPSLAEVLPSFRLDGHVTVVTGGSGGLAHTLTQALLAQGSEVALLDLNVERLEYTARELQEFLKANKLPKTTISTWPCDIGDAAIVEEVVRAIPLKHNGLLPDKLVHTAGYCQNVPAMDYDARQAELLVRVNLLGSLYVCQSMSRQLLHKSQRRRSVASDSSEAGEAYPQLTNVSYVLIGSMSGCIVNNPQPQVAYNMAKAGVIHMVKSLACEWARYGIRVNSISPGYIATALTKKVISGSPEGAALQQEWTGRVPLGRMADPREFVGAMLYLLSSSASSYTTGENMVVDGGYTCW
ncbi:LANO_0G16094g1_1 [Lachancea nothofagi CBS 11611]|uniref:LANO_0G16094g1_1 n=1 Tax=Lachancea nothofagi CBS 11611 TaxID=1266666 RepID=A0A1G4KKB5_9SACH|nr:LANO_0G16094g1_1 [Lachancea nothofagi CBS 11611]